jgi:NAD(P)-dependent dehydrogenase (short-subunit alcohol dehydrogenase family)
MTILVTGGSKGIGRAVAERFGVDGAHVLVNYHSDDDAADETADAVGRAGGRATLLKADIGVGEEGVVALAERVIEVTDHLDQVVHCAVWPFASPTLDIAIQDFNRALWLHGTCLLALTQRVRPLLSRGSSIFYISGRGSKIALPDYVALGAPKALAESLVRYLAVELAPDGVRINTVSCSGVLTEAVRRIKPDAERRAASMAAFNPSGRNVTADDVAATIHHLAAPDMSMVTGRELFVDGGIYTKGQWIG